MAGTEQRAAWRVRIGGALVATVGLADSEVSAFRAQLGDRTAELALEAWEAGDLGRECGACGAEQGEECRPMCTGQAAALDVS